MWENKTIGIIFPAYNEEENINKAVCDFLSVEAFGQKIVDEVLVVNNNSKDQTVSQAHQAGARVIHQTEQGYGNALRMGLEQSDMDILVLCEPDGTFVPKDLIKLLSYSHEFDMVCGTRTTPELIWDEANMGWFLRLGNLIVAKVLELLYNTSSLSDCGCTFRLIHKRAAKKIIPLLTVGKSHFLPEMIIAAKKSELSFVEIPLSYRGRIGESKITGTLKGTLKTGTAMIRLMLSQWPGYFFQSTQKRLKKFNPTHA